jgi:hypothetical protein
VESIAGEERLLGLAVAFPLGLGGDNADDVGGNTAGSRLSVFVWRVIIPSSACSSSSFRSIPELGFVVPGTGKQRFLVLRKTVHREDQTKER